MYAIYVRSIFITCLTLRTTNNQLITPCLIKSQLPKKNVFFRRLGGFRPTFFRLGPRRGSDHLKVVEDLGAFTSKVKPLVPPKLPRSSCALVFRLSWAKLTQPGRVETRGWAPFSFQKGGLFERETKWKKNSHEICGTFWHPKRIWGSFSKSIHFFRGDVVFLNFRGCIFIQYVFFLLYIYIDRVSSLWGSSHCDRGNTK